MNSSSRRIAVVGAGICGAACAELLRSAGLKVEVFDRGSRPGGRMSAQTVDGRLTDVGAAYLTATDERFAAVVGRWNDLGLIRPWTDTFDVAGAAGARSMSTGPMRWAAVDCSITLIEDLLSGQEVQRGITVDHIGFEDGQFRVADRAFGLVVLAMPDPQAARVLAPSGEIPTESRQALARAAAEVGYDPVIAVTAHWDERSWDFADAVFVNEHPRLSFVVDDGARRGDGAAVLMVHTTPTFAAEHLGDPDQVIAPVLADLGPLFGVAGSPRSVRSHRWSLAKPAGTHGRTFELDASGIGLAGDSWSTGTPRVESAWLSGRDLAAAIVTRLG